MFSVAVIVAVDLSSGFDSKPRESLGLHSILFITQESWEISWIWWLLWKDIIWKQTLEQPFFPQIDVFFIIRGELPCTELNNEPSPLRAGTS